MQIKVPQNIEYIDLVYAYRCAHARGVNQSEKFHIKVAPSDPVISISCVGAVGHRSRPETKRIT